jgi:aryl-alcohol dehydrogenase-like predicted oxidoreductase
MALELGLGITPWSPIAGGVLSGKFTRDGAATATSDRGARALSRLTERTFTILDEVKRVAAALGTTPAAVALAWVQSRAGVASTIIGARRLDQLDANLAALDLRLAPEHMQALDLVSAPSLNFPANFLGGAVNFMHNGLTVNGVASEGLPLLQPSPHAID